MMSTSNESLQKPKSNQNIQVFVRVRPTNAREKLIKSNEVIETQGLRDVIVKQTNDSRTKKFSFDRAFGMNSQQHEVYQTVVAPLIQEVIDGYNCTVFAYGQTGTGKTYTMVGEEQSLLSSQYDDISSVGMIPRALTHLFDKLRLDKNEFAMRVSYLELYNEELCDLLSTDDNVKIRIFDDSSKKGSVIVQGLKEIPVRCKDDVYKLLAKGQERRKTAATLMNAQSSRSHTVFSILVHIKENGPDGEEMLKIGKLNLVDLAGSENISKAGNEKGIRTRESVNINQSLLTLGRVITALVERAPHIPYRESKLTRLLQESLGGRTKTSIIATISCGHKDLEETLSTLDYAHRAKNIQNKPECNQRLTKKVILKEYTEEIERLERDLVAAREKNGIYLAPDSYNEMIFKIENTEKELNEVMGAYTKIREDLSMKMKLFDETKQNLALTSEQLLITEGKFKITEAELGKTKRNLRKTERSYGEAKHLLSVHQETEQKLAEQTKEIIKVADEASEDTKSLQENIRRRKEKDEHAAAFTNSLMCSLTQRAEEMQTEVNELEKHHKESTDIIVADLNAYKDSNTTFTEKIVDSLKELSAARKTFHDDLQIKFEKWIKSQGDTTDFTSFESYFKTIKEKDEKFYKDVNSQIESISSLLDARKKQETDFSDYIVERLNEQQKTNDSFSSYLQSKFNYYCQELSAMKTSWKAKSATQNDTISQIEKLLNSLKNNATEQNNLIEEKLSNVTGDIEGNGLSTMANFIQASKNLNKETTSSIEERKSGMDENYKNMLNEMQTTRKVISEDGESRKRKIDEQLENVKLFEEEVKTHLIDAQNDLSAKHGAIVETISQESSQNGLKLREIKSVVQHNLHLVVKEAQTNILSNIKQTTDDIENFKNEEVYMYRSTGDTPARKDYKFNRQLSVTSPHDRIIKRLRLEQGFNDSLMHDSSIIEEPEDEMTNFTAKEVCNSTAILESPSEVHQSKNQETIMNTDDQENVPVN